MTIKIQDKIKGAIFGHAVGDALGCTNEFLNKSEITQRERVTDIIGGGFFKWSVGEVTDDTDMTICTIKGILADKYNPMQHIGSEFVKWMESNPKDIGITILKSISNFKKIGNWQEASYQTHLQLKGKTAGNGSLMRILPVALFYENYSDVLYYTEIIAKMTHYDSESTDCCKFFNTIIWNILNSKQKRNHIQNHIEDVVIGSTFESILDKDKFLKLKILPNGYVINTLYWVLFVAYHYGDDFENALIEIVNEGEDTDTTGAILGGLLGAYHGFDAIPKHWIDKIIIKEELLNIANKFILTREE